MKSTVISSLLLGGAAVVSGHPLDIRQSLGYADPTSTGGSMLTTVGNGLGEPLNVIISGNSDAQVLTPEGAQEYFESLYYSPGSCLGVSAGLPQKANLGDGNGLRDQTDVLRFNYYSGDGGTCIESAKGGNHLRYWMQNGSSADTKAIFIAASVEYPATQSHNIVPDGYDLGRDWLTGNATNSSGTESPGGFKYEAQVTQTNLLSSVDVSQINHNIAVDGSVSVLTVKVTKTGQIGTNRDGARGSNSSQTSGASRTMASPAVLVASIMVLLTLLSLVEAHPSPPRPSSRVSARSAADAASPTKIMMDNAQLDAGFAQQMFAGTPNVATSEPVDPIDQGLRKRLTLASRLAASAYCESVQTGSWKCGAPCEGVDDEVSVLWMTGNGNSDPHKQLLWLEKDQSLVLQTEGSDLYHLASVLNDAVFVPIPAPQAVLSTLTQSAPASSKGKSEKSDADDDNTKEVRVHAGFLAAWSRSYPQSLKAVQAGLSVHPSAKRLILIGHSLGAAIAQLDLLALHSDLKSAPASSSSATPSPSPSLSYQYYGFGTPRVFNTQGASLVDRFLDQSSSVTFPIAALASSSSSSSSSSPGQQRRTPSSSDGIDFYHVHHASDVVPHLGLLSLGFRHAQNEVFLPDTNRTDINKTAEQQEALLCQGFENARCSLSRGNHTNIPDHSGPYFGLLVGRGRCK